MKTAAQILATKHDGNIYTTVPEATVLDAVKLLAAKSIGALVVMEGDAVVGIISERDYARKVILMDRSSKDTKVRDIMTSPVISVRPDQTSEVCMAIMTDNRLRHLPVIDQQKLMGIVSIGDLVKDVISDQKFIIQQFQHYIAGERS